MTRPLPLLVLALVGCSSSPAPNQAAGDATQLSIGPFDLASGQEFTKCAIVPLNNAGALDAIQLHATLAPGSHHLIVYRSSATQAQTTPTNCHPFEGILTGDVPLFIAEKPDTLLTLPSGVAYHFEANAFVKLEAHYLNSTPNALQAMGTVEVTPGTTDRTYLAADIMFCGSVMQLANDCIPPNTQSFTLDPGFYYGTKSVDFSKIKFFGFTSHEHRLGTNVVISRSTSRDDPGTPIYQNSSWDNPPLEVFDDAHLLQFGPGEGFRWQCSYDSADATPAPTGKTCFGESAASNEMCFIWAYYFPSAGHFVAGECTE
jgi:hypothetical protein